MAKTFKELIDGVKKIIEENTYERSATRRESYVDIPLINVDDEFDNYYMTVYGKDFDHDNCGYWLRYKTEKMICGKEILIIEGGIMDVYDMANIFIKGIIAHKRLMVLKE